MDKDTVQLLIGLFWILWAAYSEIRIGKLKTELIVQKEKATDAEIEKRISSLTDSELSALLDKSLGIGAKPPTQ